MANDKRGEKKKIGWFCSYVPEEMIIAAGCEPVRLKGEIEKGEAAGSSLLSNICPYVKTILESGLSNRFQHVEGIILTNSCDGMRRLYDLWTQYVQTPFLYMLEIPKNRDEHGIKYLAAQFLDLKTRMEEAFDLEISKDDLSKAISFTNDRRKMVMDLFEAQKEIPSPYQGSDLLAICMEEATRPKHETTESIKKLSEQSHASMDVDQRLPRIAVMGNIIDNPILFEMVERAGAQVVFFDTCNGLMHYTNPVQNCGDHPIEDLARRRLLKPPCARMPGFGTRIERLEQLIEDYAIEGIIYNNVKFCDYSLFETPQVEGFLRKRGLPFLVLENDYLWGDVERIKTRVEAFLEIMAGEL